LFVERRLTQTRTGDLEMAGKKEGGPPAKTHPSKAKAKRQSGLASPAPPSLGAIKQRLRNVETHLTALDVHTGLPVAAADTPMQPITFTLAAGGPTTRLTLDGKETFLLDSSSKESSPRANGAIVSVFIETWGNPGQVASIDVVNANPSPLTSSPIPVSGHGFDSRSLKASF
jgi:hypothetical protein